MRNKNYSYYGGRGIKVCDRWLSFENFHADMSAAPEQLTLDRIDTKGNYEPGNCRWATRKVQRRNATNIIIVVYKNTSMPLVDACEMAGKKLNTVYMRMRRGAKFREAIA